MSEAELIDMNLEAVRNIKNLLQCLTPMAHYDFSKDKSNIKPLEEEYFNRVNAHIESIELPVRFVPATVKISRSDNLSISVEEVEKSLSKIGVYL